ncbi:hypothetical protein RVR_447 [Actinacidiphila reveromycinica]|uniref:Uncharacterized protein n=1 Tax=Actinacidiphila reveromycinica TaxID=659352 RepID=A0A7U3VLI6_9ACTN|nr:hypothetical protein [Streptomyces sp. SN-593]BBA95547.1 hypothetical protein RVR_447 [Streptomyces sp. SN-593]
MVRTAVVEVAAWWALLVALDVVLISSVGPVELLVAAVAAAGGALAARRVRRAVRLGRPHGRGAPRAVAALPWSLLRGTAVLARAVLRGGRRPGGVRRVVLRPGTGAGWAGLLLAASADTCVLTVDEDRRAGAGAGADTGTDGASGAESGTGSGSDAGSDVGAGTRSGSDAGSGAESGTRSGSDAASDAGSGSDAVSGRPGTTVRVHTLSRGPGAVERALGGPGGRR